MSVLSKVFAESVLTDAVSCHQDDHHGDEGGAGAAGDCDSEYDECECDSEDQRGHNVLFHFGFLPFHKTCIFKICYLFDGIVISLTPPCKYNIQYFAC